MGTWIIGASLPFLAACGGIVRDDGPGGGSAANANLAAVTYNGVREHPGCIQPPCCNGGSKNTNIEITSKCKYIVRALWICGCYDQTDLDAALRACVAGYAAFPAVGRGVPGDCSGMNCSSIETCESLYDEDLVHFNMPPFAATCDRSHERNITREVYANCVALPGL